MIHSSAQLLDPKTLELPHDYANVSHMSTFGDIKEAFRAYFGVNCLDEEATLTCAVTNPRKPTNLEASVLLFPIWRSRASPTDIPPLAPSVPRPSIDTMSSSFAFHLAALLRKASWSSRNYIFLFIYSDVSCTFSRPLDEWLQAYHGLTGGRVLGSHGLVRDSIVFSFPPAVSIQSVIRPIQLPSLKLESAKVKIIGRNGLLPNMDYISSLLSTFHSAHYQTEAGRFAGSYIGFKETVKSWLVLTSCFIFIIIFYLTLSHFRSLARAYTLVANIHRVCVDINAVLGRPVNNYLERLLGLVSFMFSQVSFLSFFLLFLNVFTSLPYTFTSDCGTNRVSRPVR